ncbi:MAG TPA: hypothetical protein VHW93_07955, partial [Acidimicrobiales bacterium]|nr:hypothetical protein [Acidimicrobiales bacterium]
MAGLAAFVVGAVLLGSAVMVSASGSSAGETGCLNSSCAIAVSPDSGLSFASPVSVNGSHFVPRARGSLMECNMAPGEPTIAIPDNKHEKLKNFGSLPVGCSPPQRA